MGRSSCDPDPNRNRLALALTEAGKQTAVKQPARLHFRIQSNKKERGCLPCIICKHYLVLSFGFIPDII